MSTQKPTIPTPTEARGIDLVVVDLQTHLSFDLAWLTYGMGRVFVKKKVRTNGSTEFLPFVYTGIGNNEPQFVPAVPDNDNEGQSFMLVGNATYPNFKRGHYGFLQYPLSIIFAANLDTNDSALLATEDFTEHLMENVRQSLTRNLLGKAYTLVIDESTRIFDEVYAEFDINTEAGKTGKPLLPMTYFRFNCTVQVKEYCPTLSLDRCSAIAQNVTEDELIDCGICSAGIVLTPYSMSFSGLNDYIMATLQYSAYELERTQATSGGVWVKPTSIGAFMLVMGKFFDSINNKGWYFAIETTGKIRFSMQNLDFINGLAVNSTNSISAGVWTHIGWTYSGNSLASGVTIYINGVAETPIVLADTLTASILVPTTPLTFGATAANSLNYEGLMDDARMWNTEKSAANMLAEASLPISEPTDLASLILYNKMGDANTSEGSAIFGGTNWLFLDNSLTVDAFSSVNIGKLGRSVDTP